MEDDIDYPTFAQHNLIDDSMASNNWVISGNLTESGRPLLAGDPHLGNGIPSVWTLQHLQYGDKYVIGAAMPGVPWILLGRTETFAFANTAARTDVTDLFLERVEGDQYIVDEESRDLKLTEYDIKVKG